MSIEIVLEAMALRIRRQEIPQACPNCQYELEDIVVEEVEIEPYADRLRELLAGYEEETHE